MARFLIDAQLPPGLAVHLRECGHIAEHVNRVRLGGTADIAVWNYAKRHGATLVTKDEDFLAFSRREPSGPQVVWIRIGNIGSDALWHRIEPVLSEIIDSLETGERIVEVV
jgi:predicted nuclease of predicted toxin-antitoxin system